MTDLTKDPQTQLNPEPTLFGVGRVWSQDEYERAVLYIRNRAARMSFGAFLRSKLVGNPIAAANVRASTQPLRDYLNDQQLPVDDLDDEDGAYGPPINNWGANR